MKDEMPLTKRELARLLRAFAHMLETSAANDATAPEPALAPTRGPRRIQGPAEPTSRPVPETTQRRAQEALRKLGVIP